MHIVVLVTVEKREEAEEIAKAVLNEKLAACVNIVTDMKSVFWWEGKLDEAQEVLLLMKTTEELFQPLSAAVKNIHSYDVPEIIALPIVDGEEGYLNWVKDSVKKWGDR